jgi:hypothetical protein
VCGAHIEKKNVLYGNRSLGPFLFVHIYPGEVGFNKEAQSIDHIAGHLNHTYGDSRTVGFVSVSVTQVIILADR